MITSVKNCTKKNPKKLKLNRQNPSKNGKSKAIQTNHIKKHRDKHSEIEKNDLSLSIYLSIIYLSIFAPKVHCLNFSMICCLFRFSTDAGYIKLIVEI